MSSSLLCGFCSICKYRLICSVINTDTLRYFRLILVPSVMKRSMKQPRAHDQMSACSVCCDCSCTESWKQRIQLGLFVFRFRHWLLLYSGIMRMSEIERVSRGTFSHSTLKKVSNSNVRMNAAETMTSTERCGPRLCKFMIGIWISKRSWWSI